MREFQSEMTITMVTRNGTVGIRFDSRSKFTFCTVVDFFLTLRKPSTVFHTARYLLLCIYLASFGISLVSGINKFENWHIPHLLKKLCQSIVEVNCNSKPCVVSNHVLCGRSGVRRNLKTSPPVPWSRHVTLPPIEACEVTSNVS